MTRTSVMRDLASSIGRVGIRTAKFLATATYLQEAFTKASCPRPRMLRSGFQTHHKNLACSAHAPVEGQSMCLQTCVLHVKDARNRNNLSVPILGGVSLTFSVDCMAPCKTIDRKCFSSSGFNAEMASPACSSTFSWAAIFAIWSLLSSS